MKPLTHFALLVTFLTFLSFFSHAQTYVAGTSNGSTLGGDDGYGSVYRMTSDATDVTVLHAFDMVNDMENGYIVGGGIYQVIMAFFMEQQDMEACMITAPSSK